MAEADLVALGGFVVLFLLMLVRVPIGIAMGIDFELYPLPSKNSTERFRLTPQQGVRPCTCK